MTTLRLSLDHLATLLRRQVRLKPVRGKRVALVLDAGRQLTVDREEMKAAVRRLASSDQAWQRELNSMARSARQVMSEHLSFAQPLPGDDSPTKGAARLDRAEAAVNTVEDLLELERKEAWSLTFNAVEAARVADLASDAGCDQTAALLRWLCDRHRALRPQPDESPVRVEDLLDAKESLEVAWSILEYAEALRRRTASWERLLQKLGGMEKGVHAPHLYAAVEAALREVPALTRTQFWDRFGLHDTEGAICKDSDGKGREVLRHESDRRGVTFGGLKRYFTRARRTLGISST